MKKRNRQSGKKKKLKLNRQVVKTLMSDEIKQAAGGGVCSVSPRTGSAFCPPPGTTTLGPPNTQMCPTFDCTQPG